ncbi:MAG: AgmX/PglI C-terminal domain-containing protein [bacterium]
METGRRASRCATAQAALLVGLVSCSGPSTGAGTENRPTTSPERRRATPEARRATQSEPQGISAVVTRLGDPREQVREAAAGELKQLGARAAPALIRYYVSATGKGRAKAASLLDLLGRAGLPALAAAYKSGGVKARRQLVVLVGRIVETEAVRLLLEALDDPEHTVREQAGEALIKRTDEDEVALMLSLLRTGRPMQQQHLLEVFGVLKDPRVAPALLSTFAQEKTTQRRHNRLDALLRHPGGYRMALSALAAPNPKLRSAMLRALAYEFTSLSRVSDSRWIAQERGRFVTAWKAVGPKVLPALQAVLRSGKPAVALAAARVLHFLKAARSIRRQEKAYLAALEQRLRKLDPAKHADQLVVINARLGFLHWQRSCKKPDPLSLCMRTRKVTKGGGLPRLVRTILPRDPRLVKRAAKHFRAAWSAWDNGGAARRVPAGDPDRARRVGRARHYAAWAKFMEAELALEGFLRQGIPTLSKPTGGNRLKAARSQLTAWYEQRLTAAKRLDATYRAVISQVVAGTGRRRRGSIYWRLASLSRVGTVYLELAHQLMKIKAPSWLRDGADRTAFEEAYLNVVDRFELRAKKAYRACLQTAARKRYFWDLALHCEAEYMTTDPEAYQEWAGERRARLTRISAPAATRHVLTKEEIRHVVRSHRTKVHQCFSKYLSGEGAAGGGALQVKFRIEVDGKVTVGSVSGLNAPRTEACVRRVYAAIRFPVGPPVPTEVSYPYYYKPGMTRITF